ncbi:MAG: prepilin-type N-terminal cleavage/methylation domain-containing protein [Pseudomonadota bacterium]|nr:prepilin-type N-terminal cleavage/methylation domain-containing protein [Pseudomonadota bacterium]
MLNQARGAKQNGYSLVELMVAMALGLIVIGAVIALVLSMMRANNQTIAATRLTQELRATAALMSADLRRAGGVTDPLTSATSNGGQPDTTLAVITTATPGCIQYSYADAQGGNFHAISLQNGAVFMDAGATATCSTGVRLSSPQVTITGLTFARTGRRIDITLAGRLSSNIDSNINRAFTQSVFIRSVPGT